MSQVSGRTGVGATFRVGQYFFSCKMCSSNLLIYCSILGREIAGLLFLF